jgi:hypothetical protein
MTVWIGTDADPIVWTRLIHTGSWAMTPNRQEANKRRTSDTGGAAVKFCPDIVDWTMEITNVLCEDDWLYTDILVDQTNPSVGKTTWFFFGWSCDQAPTPHGTGTDPEGDDPIDTDPDAFAAGTYTGSTKGVYAYGTVNPPGFSMDNDGSDAPSGDWTISVVRGPYLPKDTGTGGVGAFSGSDEDAGNVESQA